MSTEVTFGKRGQAPLPPAPTTSFSASARRGLLATPQGRNAGGAQRVDVARVTQDDMELAIGPNWAKFSNLWPQVREACLNGQWAPKFSWSWAGFFFGAFWLLYRKQYSAFSIAILVNFAVTFVIPGHYNWLNLAETLLIGGYGKWWVVRSAAVTAARIHSLPTSEVDAAFQIRRQGGVSLAGTLVGVVALVALTTVIIGPGFVRGFKQGFNQSYHNHAALRGSAT